MQPWLAAEDKKLNDVGYIGFFTYKGWEEALNYVPMRDAKFTHKKIVASSDPLSIDEIEHAHFPGPMHFAIHGAHSKGKSYVDVDLESAYPTWLLRCASDNLGYKIGSEKRYYNGPTKSNDGYLETYKIEFETEVSDVLTSRFYRHWMTKSYDVKSIKYTSTRISGTIFLPAIDDLVNRFSDDLQGTARIVSTIISHGKSDVYINSENIYYAMRHKGTDPKWKIMLNSATGYLVKADKIMYFAMVNHVRSLMLKLIDRIEQWNALADDEYQIEIRAANTDGLTLYIHDDMKYVVTEMYRTINEATGFSFRLKEAFKENEANITPNDIRRIKS